MRENHLTLFQSSEMVADLLGKEAIIAGVNFGTVRSTQHFGRRIAGDAFVYSAEELLR